MNGQFPVDIVVPHRIVNRHERLPNSSKHEELCKWRLGGGKGGPWRNIKAGKAGCGPRDFEARERLRMHDVNLCPYRNRSVNHYVAPRKGTDTNVRWLRPSRCFLAALR